MGWPVEPNLGSLLVVLLFGFVPPLLMFLLYRMTFSHPTGMEDDAMAEEAARLIAAQNLER